MIPVRWIVSCRTIGSAGLTNVSLSGVNSHRSPHVVVIVVVVAGFSVRWMPSNSGEPPIALEIDGECELIAHHSVSWLG